MIILSSRRLVCATLSQPALVEYNPTSSKFKFNSCIHDKLRIIIKNTYNFSHEDLKCHLFIVTRLKKKLNVFWLLYNIPSHQRIPLNGQVIIHSFVTFNKTGHKIQITKYVFCTYTYIILFSCKNKQKTMPRKYFAKSC